MFNISWDDSYHLLRELETAVEQIDNLSEQLGDILFDNTFRDDIQNKVFLEDLGEADGWFIDFSSRFSRIYSVLEEEDPREDYIVDYEYLSSQLKKAKQHLERQNRRV